MAQNVRQFHHIPAGPVKYPGEKVPQIVGEHLGGADSGGSAQGLHLRPYLFSGNAFSASGEEYLAGGDVFFSGIFNKFPAQLCRQEYSAYFPFKGYLGLAGSHRLSSYELHFADPYACGAYGLHNKGGAPFT